MNDSTRAETTRDEILSTILNATSFDQLGRNLVAKCAELFDAEVCTIWLVHRIGDDAGLRLWAASAKAPQTLAKDVHYLLGQDPDGADADGVTGYIAQTGKEVRVESYQQLRTEFPSCWRGRLDPTQWNNQPEIYFKSLIGVPLRHKDRVVGVIKLENKKASGSGFNDVDVTVLRTIATYFSITAYSFSIATASYEGLNQKLADLVARLLAAEEQDKPVNAIIEMVSEALDAEVCTLWLVDERTNELRYDQGVGFKPRNYPRYKLADQAAADKEINGITAWVASKRKPFWANSWDVLREHKSHRGYWDEEMWPENERRFRCLYAVPLLLGDRVIGVFKVENKRNAAFFSLADRTLCDVLANLIVVAIDLSRRVDRSRMERIRLRTSIVHEIRNALLPITGHVESDPELALGLLDDLSQVADAIQSMGSSEKSAHADVSSEYGQIIACATRSCKLRARARHEERLIELFATLEAASDALENGTAGVITAPCPLQNLTLGGKRLYIVLTNLLFDAWRYCGADYTNGSLQMRPENAKIGIELEGNDILIRTGAQMPDVTFARSFSFERGEVATGFVTPNSPYENEQWDEEIVHMTWLRGSGIAQMIADAIGYCVSLERMPEGLCVRCARKDH